MFELIQDFWTGVREAAQGWVVTFYAKQFGKNERIQFYESLMGVLEDGIAIEEALETVANALADAARNRRNVDGCELFIGTGAAEFRRRMQRPES